MTSESSSLPSVGSVRADDSRFLFPSASDHSVQFDVMLVCPSKSLYASYDGSNFLCGSASLQSNAAFTVTTTATSSSPTLVRSGTINFNSNNIQLACSTTSPVFCLFSALFSLDRNYLPYSFSFTLSWSDGTTTAFVYPFSVFGSQLLHPVQLRSYYHFAEQYQPVNPFLTNYTQAIGAFYVSGGTGYYSPTDLSLFYSTNNIATSNVNLVTMTGATNDPSSPDAETELDVQWITGIAAGIRTVVFHSSSSSNSPFEDVLTQLQSASPRPSIISFSYGADEILYVQQQASAVAHINLLFQTLGAAGVTVLASSGDTGCHITSTSLSATCTKFRPSFPASSPYVTAVGATQLYAPKLINGTKYCPIETVASAATGALITGGGGFSSYFSMPSYQASTVRSYLSNCSSTLPSSSFFNSSNRAFPDISLLGHSFSIFVSGVLNVVDGTSASAPALAAFLSLLNDARRRIGQPVLGFLNPLLYSTYQSYSSSSSSFPFNDVGTGDNSCLRSDDEGCCGEGFAACPGYFDAVTGVGSPNFEKLAQLWIANSGQGLGANATYSNYAYIEGCEPAPSSSSDDGLAVAYIVVIVLLCLGVLSVCVCWLRRRCRRSSGPLDRYYRVDEYGRAPPGGQVVGVGVPVPVPAPVGFTASAPSASGGTYARLPGN